ncbi:MAG: hypothetical protein CME79_11310 [Halomonas sp.]|nr:hypothetical protein [Halomonas sp.]
MKEQSVNAGERWPKRVQFQPSKLGAAIFIERFAIERETQLLAAALVVTSVAPSNAASHSVLFVGRCTVTISFVGLGNTMHSYTHTTNS